MQQISLVGEAFGSKVSEMAGRGSPVGSSISRARSGVKGSQSLPPNGMIASPRRSLVVQSNDVGRLVIRIRLSSLDDWA